MLVFAHEATAHLACHSMEDICLEHLFGGTDKGHFMSSPVESKTRAHHGPVGSGRRTAWRRGAARLGRTGRRWVDPAGRQPSLLPSSESRTMS